MSRLLPRFRGGDLDTPSAYSPLQSWVSLVVPMLALVVDALAFYPVLAIVLPSLTWYFLIPVVAGLAAGAVYLSDRIGLGLRQRQANDPARSDVLTAFLLALWIGVLVGMFFARLLLGSGSVTLDEVPPAAGSTRDLFGAVTFAVLYLLSGAIAMVAAWWLYRPARDELARATDALATATEREQVGRSAVVRARARVDAVNDEVDAERARAPYRRDLLRHHTDVDIWSLKHFAREEMAATAGDERGRALWEFMQDFQKKPDPPKEQP